MLKGIVVWVELVRPSPHDPAEELAPDNYFALLRTSRSKVIGM